MYDFAVVAVQFLWGLLVKHAPFLAKVPNRLIPVFNLIIAFIAKVWAPEAANAGFFSGLVSGLGGLGGIIVPVLQTILARQLHETFVRPVITEPPPAKR